MRSIDSVIVLSVMLVQLRSGQQKKLDKDLPLQ